MQSGVNVLSKYQSEDEPISKNTISRRDAEKWLEATWAQVRALQQLDCLPETKLSDNIKVLHAKFVLRRERNQFGDTGKYKPRLMVCGHEEEDIEIDCISAVVDKTIIKMLLCLTI